MVSVKSSSFRGSGTGLKIQGSGIMNWFSGLWFKV
jgi:hypothetical protein